MSRSKGAARRHDRLFLASGSSVDGRRSRCAVVICWAVLLATAWSAHRALGEDALIELSKARYAENQRVVATIRGHGSVGIESDLQGTSYTVEVNGERKVDLGRARRPGFYVVRAIAGERRDAVVFFIVPERAGYTVAPIALPKDDRSRLARDNAGFRKFVKNLTGERIRTAFRAAYPEWVRANTAKIPKTLLVGGLCVGGVPLACGEAAQDSLELAAGLATAVLRQAAHDMRRNGLLTVEEAGRITKTLTASEALVSALGSRGALDRLFTAVQTYTEMTAESDGVRTVMKWSIDEAGKIRFLLRLQK